MFDSPRSAPGAWYGWKIMLVDLASAGLIVGGSFAAQDGGAAVAIPVAGGAGYLLGGPLVHALQGEHERVPRSILLRVLVPLGAGALGAGLGALAAGNSTGDICTSARACGAIFGGFVGVSAGMLGAMAADWWTARSRPLQSASPPGVSSTAEDRSWMPLVLVQPRTRSVMLAVRF
jgi:hypothetical protein